MSKGIVVEQHRKYLIVLTTEGMFEKAVPVSGVDVGKEIFYQPLRPEKNIIRMLMQHKKKAGLLATACILLLVFFPVYFLGDAEKTYAYVNVDINPSLELTVNDDMKIRSVKPLNGDAKKLIHQMKNVKGKKLAAGLQTIMASSEEQHLIKNGKQMLVGVNQKSGKIKVAERIANLLHANKGWEIAAISIPDTIREKAEKKHVSMNKMVADETLVSNEKTADSGNKIHISKKERAIINHIYKQPAHESNEKVKKQHTSSSSKRDQQSSKKTSPKKQTNKTKKTKKVQQKHTNKGVTKKQQSQAQHGKKKQQTHKKQSDIHSRKSKPVKKKKTPTPNHAEKKTQKHVHPQHRNKPKKYRNGSRQHKHNNWQKGRGSNQKSQSHHYQRGKKQHRPNHSNRNQHRRHHHNRH